eukprot:6988-Heterococcus_DN1.PRE.5
MPAEWVDDDAVAECPSCNAQFATIRRNSLGSGKTHCRYCGNVFCQMCCHDKLLVTVEDVVRPPPDSIKNVTFNPSEPQRVCNPCAQMLRPMQDGIKRSRLQEQARAERALLINNRPHYTVTVLRGRGSQCITVYMRSQGLVACDISTHLPFIHQLQNDKQQMIATELRNSKKKLEPVSSAVVTLSLDNVTHTTACAKDVLAPTWEQSFLFAVNSELGNAMKVKLYDESKQCSEQSAEQSVSLAGTCVLLCDAISSERSTTDTCYTASLRHCALYTHAYYMCTPQLIGSELCGESLVALDETGSEGRWIPLHDKHNSR